MNNPNKFFPYRVLALTVMVFSVALLFQSCKGGKSTGEDQTIGPVAENLEAMEAVKEAEKIFYSLPSPLESAILIKNAGANFNQSLLNPVDNTVNYTTNKSMALNLGIYTCDLSFASLYDQTQLLINYMNAAKKMADGLGILDAINTETIEKLEENINNSEVIMEIVSETFLNSNSYLEDNQQPAIATIVLVGGWVEGLYIATQLVDLKDFDGNKLVGRIIDQKLSIDILQNLLNNHKQNPAIDQIITQVNELKLVFDKIKITSSPVRTEIDKATNVTILKSEIKTDMTKETFMELSKKVAEIRNSFIK